MYAVLVHDRRLCLIRRRRPAGVQHSLPGGLVEDGEDPIDALRPELPEELASTGGEPRAGGVAAGGRRGRPPQPVPGGGGWR
ncbi:NUDIX domain-containing protein [Kitasatospora sp. MAA19]|uniref:NUDIX domain-containing protein n=1 Tax=Kitasatospora sp. MAA19 TaxID=3035090 RepID=UPI002475B2F5|nr:NUDIX domain-containing protein [Kitasatospora sp. MAA19]